MDNTSSTTITDSGPGSPNCMNGSMRRSSPGPCTPTGAGGRPDLLMDHNQSQPYYVGVVVNKDEKGYGMKVSGDNPVYVQSVKEGGAAERAGLHAGDKIIKVNGVNVMQSTHTQVVALIKSSSQVVLTVQQRSSGLRNMASPSVHTRPVTTPTSSRITGPQPVDNEKQHQLQLEKEQYYRLMIEKEQHYVDLLRSQIASSPDEKKCQELAKTERNLQTLQAMLLRSQTESPNPTHHRTKSSPETLMALNAADGSRKLSESMNDLRQEEWEGTETPPGTPPPPYPSPQVSRRDRIYIPEDADSTFEESLPESPSASPFKGNGSTRLLANSSPIHAANPQVAQEPIISMEDDEMSDQEINQFKDHGYFKSLSKLWEHLPHLAVFTNYILSNSDPNSLMFYLLTDLYKEGNAKEMRKWAFEIHSCFLVPGAPLRLSNVDENIAREIDDVLTKEFDKEDRLRKIFWKARSKAKEELTELLSEFQQKRTAGLGTIFGPTDQALAEIYNDKVKETKLYENLFLEKLEPYLEEIEKENCDMKRYYTAVALATVLTRIFQIRSSTHALDRCPMFVSKEKSFRTKFIGKYSRKLSIYGHQYIAQQYYTIIGCNNCHQIIYGISPQGYQCSVCHINLHRHCVKLYDDSCPGPIIKKDRGIRKLIGMKDSTDHSRIKKTTYFLQMEKERRQMEERDSSFELNESGDVKQGQPVSRSGSDRRPDAVREEGLKFQDSSSTTDSGHDANEKAEIATPDSTTSLPATGSKRRINSNINRSESVKEQSEKRKQRRNISDPSHNTTGGDVDLDKQPGLSNTDSGSSSNSSISCNGRLSESPSNSVDTVGQTGAVRGNLDSDSDMDVEAEPWQSFVPPEELRNLPPHEKKRQDVINELFHTEGSHVRNLKVLYKIFYKKLQESQILKPDELNLIFPNIKEILDIHTEINKAMRRRRKEDSIVKEIGDILVNMFDDRQGESLKKAAATFCERQQLALEFIKRRRERDSKFDALLSECEKKRQCRRLPLQGILPTEMQRLSKYPLLLERLINSVENNMEEQSQQEELIMLKRAQNLSKEILNYVNEAAKVAHNRHRLEEIQKHLDSSNFERSELPIAQDFKALDLTKFKLIIEGGMQLRRPNKPVVPVHILLLEEAVIILHREGDKFLLKFFQSGSNAQPAPLSPIIKMSTLIVRTNAVCKNALFLVNTSTNNSQMYDLMAEDEIKREVWFKHFSDATESHKKREGKRQEAPTDSDDSESVQDLPPSGEVVGRAEAVGGDDNNAGSEGANEPEDKVGGEDSNEDTERGSATSPEMVAGGGIQTSKVSAEEWPLIQPSQVNIAVPPVLTAESMLTPLEQIKRKDALVKQALEDKEGLVADMMSIPREHFQHIADMAGVDTSTSREPSERLLAAIFQVDQLQKAINQSLNITEYDAVTAKGGKHTVCASQLPTEEPPTARLTIPVNLVTDLVTSLSSQLTTLLSDVKQIEEERDMLRKEVHKMRERIHADHNLHSPVPFDDSEDFTSTTDCASEQHNLEDSSLQIVTKSDCEEDQS